MNIGASCFTESTTAQVWGADFYTATSGDFQVVSVSWLSSVLFLSKEKF